MDLDQRYIERRLCWADTDLRTQSIQDSELLDQFSGPIVVLGDPGIGKTRLMERLGKTDGHHFIRANSLLRKPDGTSFGNSRLIIDGLDEVAALGESDPLNNVLTKLLACGAPPFVISCRSMEWKGKSAEIDVSDEYGVLPQVVDLDLLTDEEAYEALATRIDAKRAQRAIYSLKAAGLEGFYQNPLYLDFVAAIVASEKEIPSTRAELYERAIAQLCIEFNPHHSDHGIAILSRDSALDAAGAIMAAMLVTNQAAVTMRNDSEALPISELTGFADINAMKAVLGSNLFRSTDSATGQFVPFHKTVSEFVAARWFGAYVDQKMDGQSRSRHVANRLMSLICSEGGVPASLRGLHAWLPKFSPSRLGPAAISRDPYGVVRYGDGDGLAPTQAKALVAALRQLSAFDPYFRGSWKKHEAVGGLAQPGLLEDVRLIIMDEGESVPFRSLFLEAIVGSEIAVELEAELAEILFNPKRTYIERRTAGEVIASMSEAAFCWSEGLERLIKLGDELSTRAAVELLDDIGFESVTTELIARVIVVDCRLLEDETRVVHRTLGTFYALSERLPEGRIAGLLDALYDQIESALDPQRWWSDGFDEGWSELSRLVNRLLLRLLKSDPNSIEPVQLWNWLRMIERRYYYDQSERKEVAEIVRIDERLRRGVQRIAILEADDEDLSLKHGRLSRLSIGFELSLDDAKLLLEDVVSRMNPADRRRWHILVEHFREDGTIPAPIRKIARPYAKGDDELQEFLVRRPKRPKQDEWGRKYRRLQRDRKRREEKREKETRATYTAKIESLKAAELEWVTNPSKAYLNMSAVSNRNVSPEARIEEWLGPELLEATLVGIEAALHREDLPTAEQISESYVEGQQWYFVFPMLAGAAQRWRNKRGFDDLPDGLISSLLIAGAHELVLHDDDFDGLENFLRDKLRDNEQCYEAHLRCQFEPFLEAKGANIPDLSRFTRDKVDRPLAVRLAIDWLERFPELPSDVEVCLAECIIYSPEKLRNLYLKRLVKVTRDRLAERRSDDDRNMFWRGIQFSYDIDEAVAKLPPLREETRDWLWALSQTFYDRSRNREYNMPASLQHLEWLFCTFRPLWPHQYRPTGSTNGDQNPWDATNLLEWVIHQIGRDPAEEATELLSKFRSLPQDGYTPAIQATIAEQHRVRLEAKFSTPSIADYKAVLSETGQPRSPADVQAIMLVEIENLQERLRGDPLDPASNFYSDDGVPKKEPACRNQMLLLLGDNLPFGIQGPSEVAMPQGKRADGAFSSGRMIVPLECKGQWHNDVWSAAETQLDRYYTTHHNAASKGIYVVFWFGIDVPANKQLKTPPNGGQRPASAEEMQLALEATLPAERRADVAIVVLDLS